MGTITRLARLKQDCLLREKNGNPIQNSEWIPVDTIVIVLCYEKAQCWPGGDAMIGIITPDGRVGYALNDNRFEYIT